MTNLILCGGVGERLWPISRSHLPKQFNRFLQGASLLQRTALRNRPLCSRVLLATGMAQLFLAQEQLQEIGVEGTFLVEPVGRGTGPAVTMACLCLPPDELVLMSPSDHHIGEETAYRDAILTATDQAAKGHLMLLGIPPAWPEPGFGYIHAAGNRVLAFREKPDVETARLYVQSGTHFWNSGILIFRVGDFLDEMARWRPDVLQACREAVCRNRGWLTEECDCLHVSPDAMERIPAVSVDHAVLEHCGRLGMVPCNFHWSDMGSFESLRNALAVDHDSSDDSGNVVIGTRPEGTDFLQIGSSGNLVYSDSKRVAAIDVSDLMIVDTRDAVLVGRLSSAQKVRELVGRLAEEHSPLKDQHETEQYPWGHCTVLLKSGSTLIRLVSLKPGAECCACRMKASGGFPDAPERLRETPYELWVVLSGEGSMHEQPPGAHSGSTADQLPCQHLQPRQMRMVQPSHCCFVRNEGKQPLQLIQILGGEWGDAPLM